MTVPKLEDDDNKFSDYTSNIFKKILNSILIVQEEIKATQKSICNLRKDLRQSGVLKFKDDKVENGAFGK